MSIVITVPVFHVDQRVVADHARDVNDFDRPGGPGVVTRIEPAGGGDHWIWVRLDGATDAFPYLARQLREEPPV
jgi:hypothetical protein